MEASKGESLNFVVLVNGVAMLDSSLPIFTKLNARGESPHVHFVFTREHLLATIGYGHPGIQTMLEVASKVTLPINGRVKTLDSDELHCLSQLARDSKLHWRLLDSLDLTAKNMQFRHKESKMPMNKKSTVIMNSRRLSKQDIGLANCYNPTTVILIDVAYPEFCGGAQWQGDLDDSLRGMIRRIESKRIFHFVSDSELGGRNESPTMERINSLPTRLDSDWLEYQRRRSLSSLKNPEQSPKFGLVISRPSSSNKRQTVNPSALVKRQILNKTRHIFSELGLSSKIYLHPHEAKDVLPPGYEIVSNEHYLSLIDKAQRVVTLGSSLDFDSSWLGKTPIVYRPDLWQTGIYYERQGKFSKHARNSDEAESLLSATNYSTATRRPKKEYGVSAQQQLDFLIDSIRGD